MRSNNRIFYILFYFIADFKQSRQDTLARERVSTQGTLPREHVSTQGMYARVHISKKGQLARVHLSAHGKLALQHVSTQGTQAHKHVSAHGMLTREHVRHAIQQTQYFSGIAISPFVVSALPVSFLKLDLNLNDSEFNMLSLRSSLQYCHRLHVSI